MVGFLLNMFIEKLKQAFAKIRNWLSSIPDWIIRLVEGLAALVVILGFLELQSIRIFQKINAAVILIIEYLQLSTIPRFIWLVLIVLVYYLFQERKKLSLVAGDFSDDFRKGLDKWEFGGEGWKIENEEGIPVLSVSESRDGGIAKRGLGWRDYEFIFDTKIVNKNSGWIVRAVSRSKCLMVQLNMEEIDNPKLRFHLRIPGPVQYSWIMLKKKEIKLNSQLKLLEWINVKTVVYGCNIDIYLNGEHVAHYFIDDPIRIPKQFTGEKVTLIEEEESKEVKIQREYVPMDFWTGTIGFRCSPGEHAHFKDIKVKSIF